MISKQTEKLSLLEQIENAGCKVDVDTGDPELAKKLPFIPHDMTSNQILVHEQIVNPVNKELVESTIKSMKDKDWVEIHAVLTAKLHKKVIPLISGRVLAQTRPINAYKKDEIIKHARIYAKAYNAEGISNDRFQIKIPTTTAGVQAAAVLYEEGIRTLGTALFSLQQAIAAQQANMLSISPYYNEVRAHVEQDLWPDVEDPATQHPMSARMAHIRQTYDKLKAEGKTVPLIKAASCITARECLGMLELGADSNTILAGPLDDLLSTPQLPAYKAGQEWQVRLRSKLDSPHFAWQDWSLPESSASKKRMAELAKSDPLSSVMAKDWKMASPDTDYLADGVLDAENEKDEVTRRRLKDAIDLFDNAEKQSEDYIKSVLAQA